MKVFRVLSTAFVRILLIATCHTSALSSGHVALPSASVALPMELYKYVYDMMI